MNTNLFKNKILQRLDSDVIQGLQLKQVNLPSREEIEIPGEPTRKLIFIENGVGSMTTTFQDGFQVEVGLFGLESVMGASALIGTRRSLNRVYMQIEGYGFACPMALAVSEFSRFGKFHDLVLRFIQAELVQTCQSAGCNSHHEISQRLSRWLLLCADRFESATLPLTQEYLGHMLGNRRPTVSVAAETLQREGLIKYSRGKVVILDRAALEDRACECYRVVKDHLDNFLEVEQD
jgi:CRP-like cAMP-binding protein